MKKENGLKRRLKSLFPSNPLSYLGWLGVLGILGILFVPSFIPFLLFFTFFSYKNMKADELFWENVRRASTRGFWSVFAVIAGGMSVLFIRGMMYGGERVEISVAGNAATVGAFSLEQYMLGFLILIFSMTLMILVFSISMIQFRRREKKLMERQE